MENPKKIIKAFEKCILNQEPCHGCYQDGPGFGFECRKSLCRDVLVLLYNAYGSDNIHKFLEVYYRIMNQYSWKRMINDCVEPEEKRKKGRKPKYVRFSLDTRDGEIWCATFAESPNKDISFRLDDKQELKDMYDWLDRKDEVL